MAGKKAKASVEKAKGKVRSRSVSSPGARSSSTRALPTRRRPERSRARRRSRNAPSADPQLLEPACGVAVPFVEAGEVHEGPHVRRPLANERLVPVVAVLEQQDDRPATRRAGAAAPTRRRCCPASSRRPRATRPGRRRRGPRVQGPRGVRGRRRAAAPARTTSAAPGSTPRRAPRCRSRRWPGIHPPTARSSSSPLSAARTHRRDRSASCRSRAGRARGPGRTNDEHRRYVMGTLDGRVAIITGRRAGRARPRRRCSRRRARRSFSPTCSTTRGTRRQPHRRPRSSSRTSPIPSSGTRWSPRGRRPRSLDVLVNNAGILRWAPWPTRVEAWTRSWR